MTIKKTARTSAPFEDVDTSAHCLRAPGERWQHSDYDEHALDAARPKWRFQRTATAADRLLRRGDIDTQHHQAFGRYREDYELGVHGASPSEKRGSGGGIACFMDVRLGALSRVRGADAAVGEEGRALLYAFAVLGLSYVSTEATLSGDRTTVLGGMTRESLKLALVRALDVLARHYSGELYRVRVPVVSAVQESMEALPRRVVKPLDVDGMRVAVAARMVEYRGLRATPDAVAILLRAEFGDWAEQVLED